MKNFNFTYNKLSLTVNLDIHMYVLYSVHSIVAPFSNSLEVSRLRKLMYKYGR